MSEEVRRLEARIAKLRARLECDHVWAMGSNGEMFKLQLEDDNENTDGIACRDATIRLLEQDRLNLRGEVIKLKDALRNLAEHMEALHVAKGGYAGSALALIEARILLGDSDEPF